MKALAKRRRLDRDLEDELAFHLAMRRRSIEAGGMPPGDAEAAARRRFGNVTAIKEACRDMWTFVWLESWWQDLRYGARQLRRSPGFTLVAALSLALGVGANSAMFSVADFLVLRPLPVPDPSRVVELRSLAPGRRSEALSYPEYLDFRARSRSFEALVASRMAPLGIASTRDALPQPAFGLLVSDNYFQGLDVAPEAGRAFRSNEADPVAVIGHSMWAARPDALGGTLFVNGLPFTVVGVAPEKFSQAEGPIQPAVYILLANGDSLERRGERGITVRGRLRADVTLRQADAEAKVIARQLEQTYPDTNRNRSAAVRSIFQVRLEQYPGNAAVSALLLALTGIVLLIACANVANLLLSRARARSQEIAVRLSIGASRGRLLRQLLTESCLVALAGGALGLLVAQASVRFFSLTNVQAELPVVFDFRLNPRVALYAIAVSLGSAIVFGLLPALQATRGDLAAELRRRRFWGRNVLVILQVAGSLLLLVCAAQILRGTSSLLAAPPGFRTGRVLLAHFNPKLARSSPAYAQEFYRRLLERARTLPGVKDVALARSAPFSLLAASARIVPEGGEPVSVRTNVVGPNYFDVLDIPILHGRDFHEMDKGVAIVNEKFARTYATGVGKRLRLEGAQVEIVGIARQSKYVLPSEPPREFLYLPLEQQPQMEMTLLVESYGDPAALAAPLRAVVHDIDFAQPVFNVVTMQEHVRRATGGLRLASWIFGAMGFLGLLLSMVGLYGLVAYAVSRRTREIGIRVALGAGRGAVRAMVLRQGFVLAGAGVAIGLALSPALSAALAAATYLPPLDKRALLSIPLALLAIAGLGAYLPARRASRVDPIQVLRQD